MTQAVISIRDVHKWHTGLHVLKGINLDFKLGEAVGLIGDNGAGKSTLISILSGVYPPDRGSIAVNGTPVSIKTPKAARQLGIETIYQYNALIPSMSIARNFFIGREPLKFAVGGFGWLDRKAMYQQSVAALAEVGLHMRSPNKLVHELSGGQRQGVAIARAMHFKSQVLILDEPTNHLSVRETEKVIQYVRGLKNQGITGIFISHNMHHVFESCDRIVAMARGEVIFDRPVSEATISEVQQML